MSAPKLKRRRIVPDQITSPSKNTSSITDALNAPIVIGDLKEQAKKGRELGPGRKIWVDLKPYQKEQRQVNWKRLVEEQMVDEGAPGEKAPGEKAPGEDGGPSTTGVGLSRSTRPLDAWLKAMTRAMNTVIDSSDSDDGYDTVPVEDDGDGDGDDDGSEDENENEKEGDVNAEVNLEENAEGERKAGGGKEGDDAGNGGKGEQQEEGGKAKKPRKRRGNSYDYQDDWIDDSEFIKMVEYTDNRRGKHRGFVIYRGKIERDEADNEAGYEYDEEKGTRQRKRANARASKSAKTPRASTTPSGKSGKAKKEAPPPYQMPDDVIEAIERVESIAREILGAGGSSKNRKGGLPKRVREALLRGEPAFKPEIEKEGLTAQRPIVDRLMKSLGEFSSRQNINAYVTGRMGGALRQDLVFSADIVRDIVKDLKPVDQHADNKPVFESDDGYLKHIPLAVLSKVAKQIRLGLQGESLESDRATTVLNEVLGSFPPDTMDLSSLIKLVPEVEAHEKKIEENTVKLKKRTKEADRGIKAVEAMGVQVNDLDVDMAVEKAAAQGADENALRELLLAEEAQEDEYWACALKLLAVAGPYGLKIKFIGTTGQNSELLKKGKDLHIRTVASKITKLFNERCDVVAKLKDSKGYWGLRLFPGVEFEEPEWKKDECNAQNTTTEKGGSKDTSHVGDKRSREEQEGDDDDGGEDEEIEDVDDDDDDGDDGDDDGDDGDDDGDNDSSAQTADDDIEIVSG